MKVIIILSGLIAAVFAAKDVKLGYVPFPTAFSENTGLGIINGDEARRNQFPYQVSIQKKDGNAFKHHCGGTILNERYILTAAHCTSEDDPSMYRIVAGVILLSDVNITGQQYIYSMEFIQHPLYPGSVQVATYDISLIKLAQPLKFTENVQPIGIPEQDHVPAGNGTLSGWGLTKDYGEIPDHLQYADVPAVPADVCMKHLDDICENNGFENRFDVKLMICSEPAKDFQQACGGDSGGPFVSEGKVVGVVSWAIMPCEYLKDGPTVYTNVAALVDWITENTDGEVKP